MPSSAAPNTRPADGFGSRTPPPLPAKVCGKAPTTKSSKKNSRCIGLDPSRYSLLVPPKPPTPLTAAPLETSCYTLTTPQIFRGPSSQTPRNCGTMQALRRYGSKARPSRHSPRRFSSPPLRRSGSKTRPSRHSSPGPRTATIPGARIMIDGITGKYTHAPTLYRIALMTRPLNFSKWLTRSLPQR